MNSTLKALSLTVIALNLTACFQIKAPLCDASNLADLPDFDGRYEMRSYDSEKFETQKQSFSIQHVGHGLYNTPSGRMEVCLVNGKFLVQGRSENGRGYSIQWARVSADRASVSLSSLAADVNTLRQNGVPYEIISSDHLASTWVGSEALTRKFEEHSSKTLLIDNSRLAPAQFLSILDAVSLDIVLWRVK